MEASVATTKLTDLDAPLRAAGGVAVAPAGGAAEAERLRVLLVVESSGGGTGRHVLDLAEGLGDRGCDVHVVYSTGRADRMFLDRIATLKDLPATGLPMRTSIHPADLSVARRLRRYVRQHGPFDVIHGHSSKGGALARLAALGSDADAFYTLHGLIMMDPGLARWKRAVYLSIELALGLRTRGIIAVSPEEARAAVRLGLGRSRVLTIPNGVGAIDFTPRDRARRAMGAGDGDLLIGFVGRLVDQKAPHVLIGAFASAAARLPNARLVMVGDGPLRPAMEELARQRGVGDRVLWLGERDARTIMAGLDLFALSSRKEGLPYVVLEAMAAGLPIVATAASGVEILVRPGENGVVVPTDDAAAFAEALVHVAIDDARRGAMGRASLRRVEEFTVDAMVDRTLEAYLQRRAPRRRQPRGIAPGAGR